MASPATRARVAPGDRLVTAQPSRWARAGALSRQRSHLRRIWREHGELWTDPELDALEAEIKEEVGQQLGGWDDAVPMGWLSSPA